MRPTRPAVLDVAVNAVPAGQLVLPTKVLHLQYSYGVPMFGRWQGLQLMWLACCLLHAAVMHAVQFLAVGPAPGTVKHNKFSKHTTVQHCLPPSSSSLSSPPVLTYR
jgi:hypothetical protein